MVSTENLIPLVYSKPEIWDQSRLDYSSKTSKVKAWAYIAENLGVTADVAKTRWTNLRDLFRRELKKTLKLAEVSGDPDAYKPRWKHFKSMLFLKEQMVSDDTSSFELQFDEQHANALYPQTILEDVKDFKYESDCFLEEAEPSPGSTSSHHQEGPSSSSSRKRTSTSHSPSSKMARWSSNCGTGEHVDHEMDDDYHFLMSILPSLRRIHQERKTSFRMKVLQLIVDEEKDAT